MDGSRFDLLARFVAGSMSRRKTLGGLAGGILVALDLAQDETSGLAKKKKGKKGKKKDKKKECGLSNPIRCGQNCCRSDETCRNGRCLHHCKDGIRNFGEADVDCGRLCVEVNSPNGLCGLRKRCEVDGDCQSLFCREPQPGAGRQCVECLIDTHCGDGRCLDNFCFGCAIDADCPRPNDPPEFEFCLAIDNFCPNNQPCVCRECRQDNHCPAARPHCQIGTGTNQDGFCFECLEDTDCPEGQLCDEDGRCENLLACEGDQDFCVDGILGCNGRSQCLCRQTVTNEPFCSGNAGTVACGCPDTAFCVDVLGLPPGTQCVRTSPGSPFCPSECETACAFPCPPS